MDKQALLERNRVHLERSLEGPKYSLPNKKRRIRPLENFDKLDNFEKFTCGALVVCMTAEALVVWGVGLYFAVNKIRELHQPASLPLQPGLSIPAPAPPSPPAP